MAHAPNGTRLDPHLNELNLHASEPANRPARWINLG